NWAFEPISIHLSYSSRISSFWAVVKCPRLEERDGTSKDITDFSPRQYCQITVTRQPDTEGVHRGLGAPPLVGLSSVRSAVVSAMEDRGRSAGPICSASPCPGSLFPARRTSRPVHIETAEGIWQAKTRCLRAPPYCPTAASER